MRFRVQLDAYAGPLDLLLYLVRRNELDVLDVPIAVVADQFLEILAVVEQVDVDAVGDFLDMATRLMELKSRMMLPRQDEAAEEQLVEDPRQDLVKRLLEYRRFKEAADALDERARQWRQRYSRRVNDLDEDPRPAADQPLVEIELWDLVSAFARVMRDKSPAKATKIRYDDTPIEAHMDRIFARLEQEPRLAFTELFDAEHDRSYLVGTFLAVLELIRRRGVRVEQDDLFGEIWVLAPLVAAAAA
ncbi:MAG: segregation/condensation protein A [Pirellulales bacterium]|nr:segregation/condensation protein A [Pirellulales bacterium]